MPVGPGVPIFRCAICDKLLDSPQDYKDHLKTAHPSYAASTKKNARNSLVALILVIATVLGVFYVLAPGSLWTQILGIAIFATIIITIVGYQLITIRRHRRAWKEANQSGEQNPRF